MQTAYDTGGPVPAFPPVRAASQETIADSMTGSAPAGRAGDQPALGKLAQHKMDVVLGALERDVTADRAGALPEVPGEPADEPAVASCAPPPALFFSPPGLTLSEAPGGSKPPSGPTTPQR